MTLGRAGGSRVRTVFLGSGQFGAESLWGLDRHPKVEVVGVVTAPRRPSGRDQRLTSTPIEDAAGRIGVPTVLTPARLRAPDAIASVLELRPELVVLADYGQLVPTALLGLRHGALNLHPSLLPRHRGATPVPAAILAGDTETGVTLIKMDEGLDTGPIIAQRREALEGTETAPLLEERLGMTARGLLVQVLGPWLGGEIVPHPQPTEGATLTSQLARADGRLDPMKPALVLERQVRAYQPWPGSFVDTSLGRLIVHEAELSDGVPGDVPGTLVAEGDGLAFATAAGRLRLKRAQLAGRRPTDAASLRRGAPGLVGQTVALSQVSFPDTLLPRRRRGDAARACPTTGFRPGATDSRRD